jgi:mannose-1-phosphate guanylyltransferase/mannose-6-phosphate isomerase
MPIMPDHKSNVYPVLLAGGTGTRLWPVSRELYPKQLVSFIGKDSLVQSTIKRLMSVIDRGRVRVVCGKEHFHEIERHMEEIGLPSEGKIICEPCGRNTAPAILLAALSIPEEEKDAVLCIFPADHVIRDIEDFHKKLASAITLAVKGYIVTFGIKPHYPETGYGYIEGAGEVSAEALSVKRFVEKPDTKTAKQYVQAGNFFWNSGMFAFKVAVILEEFKKFAPELLKNMEKMILKNALSDREAYEQLPDISIDYAIMEKTDKGVVLPSDFGWSDIGSWKSLYDFLPKDQNNNVINGDVIVKATENCIIMGHERLIATNHLNHMVVVETPDSVFVSDIDHSRDVKSIVARLKEKGRKEYHKHRTEYHPWGSLTLLEKKEDFSIARIILHPGAVCTVQGETSTAKHLIVIKGDGRVATDDQSWFLKQGESTVVSEKQDLNIENVGDGPLYMVQMEYDV